MLSRLVVKNFGPIKHIDIQLKNVNVFIGQQASGKSVLAKIYTIFKAPRKFLKSSKVERFETSLGENDFIEVLEEYNISSFLKEDTEIEFHSELHFMSYKKKQIIYEPKLLRKIEDLAKLQTNFEENKVNIKERINQLNNDFIFFRIRVEKLLEEEIQINRVNDEILLNNISEENFIKIVKIISDIEINLSTNTSLYIPSERNFINIIKNASLNLLKNNVPIPKHILSFGAEIEKSNVSEIDLKFLQKNLKYKNIAGEDRIFTDSDNSIKLTEAASGIQSVLPILILTKFRQSNMEHRSFVIEEPELNLFPLAQYELIKNLESTRQEAIWEDLGTIHTYTTHSPYILSSINNLLYANKVNSTVSIKPEERSEFDVQLQRILATQINPFYATAYQIHDGIADSILNIETGLIDNNFIDQSSDQIGDDFDALQDLLFKYSSR